MNRSLNIIIGVFIGILCLWGIRHLITPTPSSQVNPRTAPSEPTVTVSATPKPPPVEVPRAPSGKGPARLEDYLKTLDPAGNWIVHRTPEGVTTGVMGGRIPLANGTQSISDVLQKLLPFLIGHQADLRPRDEAVRGPVAETQTYSQRASGYLVYGATLRVSYLPDQSAVVEISSDLRPVETVDTEIRISKETALDLINQKYQHRGIVRLEADSEPFVFGRSPSENQMAWKLSVTLTQPARGSREILVSAQDGRVLMDRSPLRR